MKYYCCPRCKEKYVKNDIRLMCSKCGYEIAAKQFEKKIEPFVYKYYKNSIVKTRKSLHISKRFIKILSISAASVMIFAGVFFTGRFFIIKNQNAKRLAETTPETITETTTETSLEKIPETIPEITPETTTKTASKTETLAKETNESTDAELIEKKAVSKKPAFISKIGTFTTGVGLKVKNLFIKEELEPNTKASSLSDKECKVGTIGEGGGVIFYDKMEYSDGWRYLEVAMDDIGPMSWGKIKIDRPFSNYQSLGYGNRQTYKVISYIGTKNPAYAVASYGNTEDWFLSTRDENQVLFAVIKDIDVNKVYYLSRETKRKITKARKYFKKRIGDIEDFVFPKENYYWALPNIVFSDNSSTVGMSFYDSNANKLEYKIEKVNGTEYIGNDEYFVRPIRKY